MIASSTRFTNSTWQNFIEWVYISKRTCVSTGKRDLPTWQQSVITRCGAVRQRRRRFQACNYRVRNLRRRPGGIAFAQVHARAWKSANGVSAILKNYSYAACLSRASFERLRRITSRRRGSRVKRLTRYATLRRSTWFVSSKMQI